MFSSEIRRDSLSSLLNKLERADEMKAHDANIPNVLLKHIETFRSDYSSNLERMKSLLQVAVCRGGTWSRSPSAKELAISTAACFAPSLNSAIEKSGSK